MGEDEIREWVPLSALCRRWGKARSTVMRWASDPRHPLPPPRSLGTSERAWKGWWVDEIEACEKEIAARAELNDGRA